MATPNKRFSKCGFIRFAHEIASLSCTLVETFEIFIYIFREIGTGSAG